MGATCVVTGGHRPRGVRRARRERARRRTGTTCAARARALDLLARDRALLHRLRWGALATARGWPSWEQQGTVMAAALREIARRPAPPGGRFDARLLAELRGGIEAHALVAAERDRLRWRLAPMLAVDRALERPACAGWPGRRGARGARRGGGCGGEPRCGALARSRAGRSALLRSAPARRLDAAARRRAARARGSRRAVRGLGRARAPRARRRSTAARRPRRALRVAFVVPEFRRGSGGHTTIANLVRGLERRGHACSIWLARPARAHRRRRSEFRAFFGPFAAAVHDDLAALGRRRRRGRDRLADRRAGAAAAPAAAPASTSCRTTSPSSTRRPPSGCGPSAATTSACTASPPAPGSRSACARAGCAATPFDLGHRPRDLPPAPGVARAPDRVLFYARTVTPRRAVPLGMLALAELPGAARAPRSSLFGDADAARRAVPVHAARHPRPAAGRARLRARPPSGSCSRSPTTRSPRRRWRPAACPPSSCARRAPRRRSADSPIVLRRRDPAGARRRARARCSTIRRARAALARPGVRWAASRTWDAAAAAVEAGLRDAAAVA